MNKRTTGTLYEEYAVIFLQSQGYQILEQNFRFRQGEIDVIARDGNDLVFVEVKYRKNAEKGHPLETVDKKKQQKISHTAAYYLMKHPEFADVPCRFDVVGIVGENVTLIRNAFLAME